MLWRKIKQGEQWGEGWVGEVLLLNKVVKESLKASSVER